MWPATSDHRTSADAQCRTRGIFCQVAQPGQLTKFCRYLSRIGPRISNVRANRPDMACRVAVSFAGSQCRLSRPSVTGVPSTPRPSSTAIVGGCLTVRRLGAYEKLTALDRPEGSWQFVHRRTHVRRRFVKRLQSDGSPIAEEALRQITELYVIEKSVRGLAPDIPLAARRALSAPIIAAFRPLTGGAALARSQGLQAGRGYPLCPRPLARPDPLPR